MAVKVINLVFILFNMYIYKHVIYFWVCSKANTTFDYEFYLRQDIIIFLQICWKYRAVVITCILLSASMWLSWMRLKNDYMVVTFRPNPDWHWNDGGTDSVEPLWVCVSCGWVTEGSGARKGSQCGPVLQSLRRGIYMYMYMIWVICLYKIFLSLSLQFDTVNTLWYEVQSEDLDFRSRHNLSLHLLLPPPSSLSFSCCYSQLLHRGKNFIKAANIFSQDTNIWPNSMLHF